MKRAVTVIWMSALMLLLAVSLSAFMNKVVGDITIYPNPMDKFCHISVTFSQIVPTVVTIQNHAGDVVKTLYSGQSMELLQFTWNRVCDDGSIAPKGKYSVTVCYEGRYTSTKKTLILK